MLNHVYAHNMHNMGFTKIGNTWPVEGEAASDVEVGTNDHQAGTSGTNQGEDDAFDPHLWPLRYHPP